MRWPHWKSQTLCWKTRRKKQKCRRLSVQQDAESYREVSDKWQASQRAGGSQAANVDGGRGEDRQRAGLLHRRPPPTRADLYTVRGEIEYWDNKVKELEVAELRGRNRMYRFVLRDIDGGRYDKMNLIDRAVAAVSPSEACARRQGRVLSLSIPAMETMALPQPRNQCAAGSSPVEMQKRHRR